MDLALEQLDTDFASEINSVFNSRPDLNSKGLRPLVLDVASFGYCSTNIDGCLNTSLLGMNWDFDLDLNNINLTPVDPHLATPMPSASYPKPILSYPCLCALAIKNSETGKLLVTQIYNFIREHFPYYNTEPKGWKNSVRHNLSHNQIFQKLDATTSGWSNKRNSLWSINPAKAAEIDEKLWKESRKHSTDIRKAMSRPEQLDMLVRGEMELEINSHDDDDDEDFMSNFLVFPSAKRQKTLEGQAKGLYVYEPAKQRKTSLAYLAMDASLEE